MFYNNHKCINLPHMYNVILASILCLTMLLRCLHDSSTVPLRFVTAALRFTTVELRMLTIRYGASTVQAGSATTSSLCCILDES